MPATNSRDRIAAGMLSGFHNTESILIVLIHVLYSKMTMFKFLDNYSNFFKCLNFSYF